jgi:ABC-2 type transport system permease protein
MNPVLRSELRKLRFTRSLAAIPLIGTALSVAAATVLIAGMQESEIASRLSEHGPLRFGPTNLGLLLLLFGVRLFTDETHHKTLASTYVSTPDRRAVLGAKAVTAIVVAIATCVAIYALVLPITLVAVDQRGLSMSLDLLATAGLFGRVTLAMTFMALLGLALGAMIRNRAVALVSCVAWLALAENLIGGLLRVRKLLPGALVLGLVSGRSADAIAALPAATVLTGVLVTAAAAALLTVRRDVG